MKKILVSLMVVFAAVAANAQDLWIGGSLGFWSNSDAKGSDFKTQFNISPEVGYNLSEDWSIAIGLGYASYKPEAGETISSLSVNPYARWNAAKIGNLTLFLDGGFSIQSIDKGDSYTAWKVGIKPGLAYSLSPKFCIVTHVGFLGYQDCDDKIVNLDLVQKGFGLQLSNNINFGVYYTF